MQQFSFAYNVQEGLLLPREARVGKVFCCRTRAHCNADLIPGRSAGQFPVRLDDGFSRRFWPICPQNKLADGCTSFRKGRLTGCPVRNQRADRFAEMVLVDKIPIGIRGGGKTRGNVDTMLAKLLNHLAERGVLAANLGHIGALQLF